MSEKHLYQDDYIALFTDKDSAYIESFKKGIDIDKIFSILKLYPYINITSLKILHNSISYAPMPPQIFGTVLEEINVKLTEDGMSAFVTFNISEERLFMENRRQLVLDTLSALNSKGVIYGIENEIFSLPLKKETPYLIAEGTAPVDGLDSYIKLIELKDEGPEMMKDGKVDFYNLKLVNLVKSDEWLGERTDPTDGTPGKSVTGRELKQKKGRLLPLDYDSKSIRHIYDEEKKMTILYSRINGAINLINGRLSVSNHLAINGDVNISTGNINFDGCLTINGIVEDGFSVEASNDIEINGELGLGNVKQVISHKGSILLRGGIASKGNALIKAKKNVIARFADNATIICEGTVNIGAYCKNTDITANEVIFDSANGKIMGGNIRAKYRVIAPFAGSSLETRTYVEISGFRREELNIEIEKTEQELASLRNKVFEIKYKLAGIDKRSSQGEYLNYTERINELNLKISELEQHKKALKKYSTVLGEGEIKIIKKAYPGCVFKIKNHLVELKSERTAPHFFEQDMELKEI